MTDRPDLRRFAPLLSTLAACSALSGGEILVEGPGTDAGRRIDGGRAVDGAAGDGARADVLAPQGDATASGRDGSVAQADGAVLPGDDGGVTKDGGAAGCGPRELCGNNLDDDCNGRVDESCACIPGETQRCYPGDPSQAGRGVCTWGTSRCEGTGEFGNWGACTGAGMPQPVQCGSTASRRSRCSPRSA